MQTGMRSHQSSCLWQFPCLLMQICLVTHSLSILHQGATKLLLLLLLPAWQQLPVQHLHLMLIRTTEPDDPSVGLLPVSRAPPPPPTHPHPHTPSVDTHSLCQHTTTTPGCLWRLTNFVNHHKLGDALCRLNRR